MAVFYELVDGFACRARVEKAVENPMGDKKILFAVAPREDILFYALEPIKHDRAGEEFLQLLSRARDARAIQSEAVPMQLRVSLRIPGLSEQISRMRDIGELCQHGIVGLLCRGWAPRHVAEKGGVHGRLLPDRATRAYSF